MKEPKIRFNEFKGEWNSIDFQDSFMPLRNNSLSRAELCKAGEIANIHYGDILINYGECLDTSVDALTYICDSNVGKGLLRNGALKKGDIIFADAAEDNTVGKCVELICKDDEKIVSGLHTIACRPEIDVAEKYLGYYLNSHHYHNQLLPHIQGSKISSISKRAINTTFIVYPCDFQEQHSIASFFTTLDAQISASTSRLASLKQIKAASLQAMFPQEGETVPKLRFKGFEGEWEKVKLGDVGIFKSNGVDKTIHNNEKIVNLLNYLDVYNARLVTKNNCHQLMHVSASDRQIKECDIQMNDIFFTPSSETAEDIGHVLVIKETLPNTCYSYHLLRYRPNKGIFYNDLILFQKVCLN